jgi:flagellar protein FliJ
VAALYADSGAQDALRVMYDLGRITSTFDIMKRAPKIGRAEALRRAMLAEPERRLGQAGNLSGIGRRPTCIGVTAWWHYRCILPLQHRLFCNQLFHHGTTMSSDKDQPDRLPRTAPGPRLSGICARRQSNRERSKRMKLIRLKQFQMMTTSGLVGQIEAMIADLKRTADTLERDIKLEENRSGVHDPDHIAYSLAAKALMMRRSTLLRSIDDLEATLAKQKNEFARAQRVLEEALAPAEQNTEFSQVQSGFALKQCQDGWVISFDGKAVLTCTERKMALRILNQAADTSGSSPG